MFHLVAWSESIAENVFNDLAPVTDDIVQIQNGHFVFQDNMQLPFIALASLTLQRARITSPTIRQITPIELAPLNIGANFPTLPKVVDYSQYPLLLRGQEEIVVEAIHGEVGGTLVNAVAIVRQSYTSPPPGDRYKLRATSVTAAVANAWTTVALTFDFQLPVGKYAVVNCVCASATPVAFRLIFDGQYLRPGFLSLPLITDQFFPSVNEDAFGVWGRFNTIGLPRAQILSTGTPNAHTFILDLVRVA